MQRTNQKIDQHLRRQILRKTVLITVAVLIFVGFMSYALYMSYGPDAEVVDYFPEINQGGSNGYDEQMLKKKDVE